MDRPELPICSPGRHHLASPEPRLQELPPPPIHVPWHLHSTGQLSPMRSLDFIRDEIAGSVEGPCRLSPMALKEPHRSGVVEDSLLVNIGSSLRESSAYNDLSSADDLLKALK
eukprot:GHVH01003395.1.p2 GENE.GHVH01003395.1~~GHVH01003395.1.p2  ORF type:complete len:113 (-),score=14.49 GHVH01003395.1:516-854(-)